MAIRCGLIIEQRPLGIAFPRPKTASGGLRHIPRHRVGRTGLQPTDAPWKNRLRYDLARRGAVLPQSDSCGGAPISSAEAAAARRGNRRAFWNSRAARGDPLAATALSIVGDSDFSGVFANSRLRGAIFARNRAEGSPLSYSAAQAEVQQIGVQLMRAHVDAVNTFGNPSAAQIAEYHFQVFDAHRLPNSTFGGSMFTGTETEAAATAHLPGVGWLGC